MSKTDSVKKISELQMEILKGEKCGTFPRNNKSVITKEGSGGMHDVGENM